VVFKNWKTVSNLLNKECRETAVEKHTVQGSASGIDADTSMTFRADGRVQLVK